ncbi:hypothetical protein R1flu_020996 [Riccia fluitans]|uniref:Uncharacterized protein n=1 Tax=Riccia fluitans TaxID=41844 RepID=A0ABD1ZN34_9MARC
MVNQVTTFSKKRGESPPRKASTSRGKRKESRPKKADKKIDNNTSDFPPETKLEERNTYKDDISDLIQKALQDQTLTDTQAVPSAPTKEPPPAKVRPPVIFPNREELRVSALNCLVNSTSPIIATMEFDLVESLAKTPAPISLLQLIMVNPSLLKDLTAWSRERRSIHTPRGLRLRQPQMDKEIKTLHIMMDKGAQEIEIEIRGCILCKVPLDTGSGVNIMTAWTTTCLGLTDLQPCKKFLRMADQSRKLPLGELKNIETSMGGIAFNLDYVVLQPEDEQGYEVLIGRPWFYGAGITEDWNYQEVCFRVEGRRTKVRIPWGPVAYHGETPQDDSDELTSAPESAYDSDHSSYGVYMSEREDSVNMCSFYLEVYETSDEDLYAYSEHIKALYINGLESVPSEAEAVEYKGATIYNLRKSTDGRPKKDRLLEGVPSKEGGKITISRQRSSTEQLQPQVMTTYAIVSSSDKEWKYSEKGGDIVRQLLSDVLNAPPSDKELTASDGEDVPHLEDKTVGATTFPMMEGMIPPGSWKEIEIWP